MVAPNYIDVDKILDTAPSYYDTTLREWLRDRIRENPSYFKKDQKQATYEAVKNFRVLQRRKEKLLKTKARKYSKPVSRDAMVKYSADWFEDVVKEMAAKEITGPEGIREQLGEAWNEVRYVFNPYSLDETRQLEDRSMSNATYNNTHESWRDFKTRIQSPRSISALQSKYYRMKKAKS